MKNILKLIVLAAALSVSGCRIEDPAPEWSKGESLRGIIDADVAATKAILVDNPGVKLESFWAAGEQIGVYGGSAENQLFTVTAEGLSYDRKTADFRTDGSIPAGKVTAYSPYQSNAGKDGDAIVVTFPAVQKYVTYNGVVQPDPAANILLGEGSKGAGVNFRNMMAFLKIGQVFEEETVVKTVEFRDLSGAAVSGAMRLSGGTTPKAEITGSGKILTLDLGEGLEFPSGGVRPLFLVVPAREYAKGFEITFIDAQGGRTVRTVGTTMGKTLNRSVVYTIGDISGNSYPADSKTVLKEGATIMTPELLDKVSLIQSYTDRLLDPDGNQCMDQNGEPIWVPLLNLRVSKDLHPQVGNWMIFENPVPSLPYGGVFRIRSVEEYGPNYYDVYIIQEGNIAAPFEEMKAGEPLYDAEGNFIEDAGIDLDLASYVSAIRDADGNSVPFSVGSDGALCLSGQDVTQAVQTATKAPFSTTFTTPKAALKYSEDNVEVSFGAQMSLPVRIAVGFSQGEVQYVYFTAQPIFKLNADFVLKAEISYEKDFHLFTIECVPIVIAPGVVICPKLDLSGRFGLSGSIQFSTSVSYTYDMGRFGLIYNYGQGFSFRHTPPKPAETEIKPEMGDISGIVAARASIEAYPYISLYGLFGLGVRADFGLKFGLENKVGAPGRLFLTPELELTPKLIVASGWYSKNFKNLSVPVEFDPIWERYLRPSVSFTRIVPVGPLKQMESFKYTIGSGDGAEYFVTKPVRPAGISNVMTDVDGILVEAVSDGATLDDWTVALDVLTGNTSLTPWHMVLRDAPVFPGYSEEDYSFTGIYSVGRYDLFDIPAGKTGKVNLCSTAGKGAFPAGQVRSYRFVYINKSTGKVYGDTERDGSPAPAYRSPFAVYWPETPDGGSWFVTEQITAEQYNDPSRYPGNCPVRPKGSEQYADGYYTGE